MGIRDRGRTDAIKHLAMPIVADAKASMVKISQLLGGWQGALAWSEKAAEQANEWQAVCADRMSVAGDEMASYAQVIGAVNRLSDAGDTVLTAAGGLPA